MAAKQDKGSYMEELARYYFNRSGHFTIRGAKQSYGGHSVTDIDLWAYSKAGINRNITLVDIKNKRYPEAFDRAIWISGLQIANNAHKSIIITTDRRKEVADFAKRMNVDVITTYSLNEWYGQSDFLEEYLSEEDFINTIKQYKYYKTDGNWMHRFESLKTTMVSDLGFASALICLDHSHFFLQRAIEIDQQDSLPLRLFFRSLAYFCVSLDYVISNQLLLGKEKLVEYISMGLTYGPGGQAALEDQLFTLRSLLGNYSEDGLRIFNESRKNLFQSLENNRIDIIAELLGKQSIYSNLFRLGQVFDISSRAKNITPRTEVIDAVIMLYMLADYWKIDRSRIKFATDIYQSLIPPVIQPEQ